MGKGGPVGPLPTLNVPLASGMIMEEADPGVFDRAVAGEPQEMRRMAQEAYVAHSRLINGTPTPPRSTEMSLSDG